MNIGLTASRQGRITGMVAVALVVAACAVSPTGRKQLTLIPEDQMITMGAQAFEDIQQQEPIEKDPAVFAYVQCVADALTVLPDVREAQSDWEVTVFASDTVNAFALPGGKIGVYTGLLSVAETPSQLAAVMGHEVAHVLARHGNERVSQQVAVGETMGLIEGWLSSGGGGGAGQQAAMALLGVGAKVGILLPFSRAHESEADAMGKTLMARAGFDPRESVTLWQNMGRAGNGGTPEFLSTHPSHDTRIRDLQEGMDAAVALYEESRAAGRVPQCKRP
jgi:predicted Zn-dependent protease